MPSRALEIMVAPRTTSLQRLVLQPQIYLRCLAELWNYCCSSHHIIAEASAAATDLPEMPSRALEIMVAPRTTSLQRLVLQPQIYLRCLAELWKSLLLLSPHHCRGCAAATDLPEMLRKALEIMAALPTTSLQRLVLQPQIYLRCLADL
jgi:hypothetical protein